MRSSRGLGPGSLGLFVLLSAALVLAVLLVRDNSYWNLSDGVYLYTADAVREGEGLYTDIAAAQPPPIYYLGAAIIALGDSLTGVRIILALANVLTGVAVLLAVHRLTARPRLAAVAGALALLTPRLLHDAANLLPETFAAPLLMAAALLASRHATAALGGVVAALAVAVKLAFALPAAALVLGAVEARRYVTGLLATGIALALVFLVAFGTPMLDGAVTAQRQVGVSPLDTIWLDTRQALWNLLPFAAPAALAWAFRDRTREPALLRALFAAAAGALAVFVTIVKHGAYINLAVVAEPFLLTLGVAGLAWAWEARGELGRAGRVAAAAGVLSVCLAGGQAASLLLAPSSPTFFARPGAPSDLGWAASPTEADTELERIESCPPDLAYGRDPYFAFLADRRMPGGQGDPFIISEAAVNAEFMRRAEGDVPRC